MDLRVKEFSFVDLNLTLIVEQDLQIKPLFCVVRICQRLPSSPQETATVIIHFLIASLIVIKVYSSLSRLE